MFTCFVHNKLEITQCTEMNNRNLSANRPVVYLQELH